jgi:hypothetical protein
VPHNCSAVQLSFTSVLVQLCTSCFKAVTVPQAFSADVANWSSVLPYAIHIKDMQGLIALLCQVNGIVLTPLRKLKRFFSCFVRSR